MEVARLLALQGHEVSLWEKERDLGGTARIASLAYEPNERLVTYLDNAVRSLPIDLQLGKVATLETIAAASFDHIILATGAIRTAPDIAGKQQRHVFDGDELRGVLFGNDKAALGKLPLWQRLMLGAGRMSQLLRNIRLLRLLSKLWMPIADEVVIIGGGLVGLELAEYLVERHRKVVVLEPGPDLGAELAIVRRARVLHLLREHGAVIHRNVESIVIGAQSVSFELDNEARSLPAKQVIIAMGAQPDDRMLAQLASSGAKVHRVGDCREVGYIDGAILDARQLVQSLGQDDTVQPGINPVTASSPCSISAYNRSSS
jgi:2,4-dienoyl-CoA reductase (NADPH2)